MKNNELNNDIKELESLAERIFADLKNKDFKEYICDRQAETKIRDALPINYSFKKENVQEIKKYIIDYCKPDKSLNNKDNEKRLEKGFVIFFAYFTYLRRSNQFYNLSEEDADIETFTGSFKKYFKEEYKIYNFLYLLSVYCIDRKQSRLKKLIDDIEILLTDESLKPHNGIRNFYAEAVCEYYETYLDEINTAEGQEELKNAYKLLEECIKKEENPYHKYYLNLGRLAVLRNDYNEGYRNINIAIKALKDDKKSNPNKESEYKLYLVKASTIQVYHQSNDRIQELSNSKNDNYKTLTLIAGLLGLITGEINIFSKAENIPDMAMLMVFYFAMILFIVGLGLLFIDISNKKKVKKGSLIFVILMIIVSIILIIGSVLYF